MVTARPGGVSSVQYDPVAVDAGHIGIGIHAAQPDGHANEVEALGSDIGDILRVQKRRRRLVFWLGFLTLAVLGALWAGLSKDPRGNGFGGDVFVGAPAPGFSDIAYSDIGTHATGSVS